MEEDPYINLVCVQKNLAKDIKKNEVIKKIVARLTELNLICHEYKNNQDVILLICNLIEFLIVKKDKIDKKEVALEVLKIVFSITPQEKPIYEKNIDFLHQSNMIKKVSKFSLFCAGLKELFFKKKK